MKAKFLGLDIGRHTVKAVQVEHGYRGNARVTGTALVRIGEAGGLRQAIESVLARLKSGTCITALPAAIFSFRNVRLPFREKKKIAQTLGFELEPLIPYPLEDVAVDFTITSRNGGSEILAAAVLKSAVSERLEVFGEADVSVIDIEPVPVALAVRTRIGPGENGIVLDIGSGETGAVFMLGSQIVQIRAFPCGSGDGRPVGDGGIKQLLDRLEQTLRFFSGKDGDFSPNVVILTGSGATEETAALIRRRFRTRAEIADVAATCAVRLDPGIGRVWKPALMNQALALALRGSRGADGFNMVPGVQGKKKFFREHVNRLKKAAALSALFALVLGINWGAGLYMDYMYLGKLKQGIAAAFTRQCPDAPRIVDPVQQLQARIDEAKKFARSGAGFLDLLQEISRLVPAEIPLLITGISLDGAKVELRGETAGIEAVETVKREIGRSRLFREVTVDAVNQKKDGNRVEFELRMTCE